MLAGVQAPKVEIGPVNSFPDKWGPILVSTRGAFWMVEDQLRLRDRGGNLTCPRWETKLGMNLAIQPCKLPHRNLRAVREDYAFLTTRKLGED